MQGTNVSRKLPDEGSPFTYGTSTPSTTYGIRIVGLYKKDKKNDENIWKVHSSDSGFCQIQYIFYSYPYGARKRMCQRNELITVRYSS